MVGFGDSDGDWENCGDGIIYHVTVYSVFILHYTGWLGSRVVSVLDSGAEGPGFKSLP